MILLRTDFFACLATRVGLHDFERIGKPPRAGSLPGRTIQYNTRMVQSARWMVIVTVLILIAHAALLYFMGQPLMYEGGYIKIWHGASVLTPENSQHLFDWYAFSHIIHGFLFYAGCTLVFPRLSLGTRLLMALAIESGWELFENTDMIIQRYREQALAQGYFGDSIVNSTGDMIAALVGFVIAWRVPLLLSVIVVILLEVVALYAIRDSLTLNIIQLIQPIDAIGAWQAAK